MREENIVTIRDYLSRHFAGFDVGDEERGYDHLFLVEPPGGGDRLSLQVSEALLDDTPPLEIAEELDRFDVAGTLREAAPRTVLLTPEGTEPIAQ